jgi:quercetin dioxygenase-like cupin family protein
MHSSSISSSVEATGSKTFVRTAEETWTQMAPGVRRQVLGHGPDLMLVRVDFERGAVGAVHHHPHRQVTYVAAGTFEVTVGGERRTLGTGDSFFAPADVAHGVTAVEAGTLIDVFTPRREDFLTA